MLAVDIFIFNSRRKQIIMATNITVYDLDNYPDNTKTVTLDHKTIVPVGYEGDEQWVLSFVTTAYSDNTNATTIQDIYVREIKAGWLKSSGLVSAPFTIGPSNKTIGIKMDAASTYYYIDLDEFADLSGDAIAADMEDKIRAIPDDWRWSSSDDGYKLAYMNASVEWQDDKFYIVSGSVSPYYIGANRSSVAVTASGSDTCYDDLGFNLSVDSQTIKGTAIYECLIGANYTIDTDTLTLGTNIGIVVGDCLMITDGTNTDYFTAISGTSGVAVKVCTAANNSYTGIKHSYVTTSGGTKVQRLKEQDPEQVPAAYYDTVDAITRWGIKSISNQIDFTS